MANLPPVKQGLKQLNKLRNIGTRVQIGRMGTFNNTTQNTFQLTVALAQKFEALQIVFGTTNATASNYMITPKLSVMSDTTDLNNNAGTWLSATQNGQTSYPVQLAPPGGSALRLGYTVSDWIAVDALDRTDGGSFYLVVIRVYPGADSSLPVWGNGTDDFTNWATKSDGRIWVARNVSGDYITTPSTWPASGAGVTNVSQSPIIGVRYLAKGKVLTVGAVGDSIIDGFGATYKGENYVMLACEDIHNQSTTAVEYCNFGWSGQASYGVSGFHERAIDILESDVRPDILVFESGSLNDPAPTLTDALVQNWRTNSQRVIEKCDEFGTIPIPVTVMATSYSAHALGSTDSLRLAHNTDIMSYYNARNILCADVATPVAGSTESHGQQELNPALCDAIGAHPNDAGNALIKANVAPLIRKAAGL